MTTDARHDATGSSPSDIPTTRLTPDGPELSVLGLGCNNFGHNPFGTFIDYADSRRVIDAAIDAGVTAFDTADVYGHGDSEEYLGRALRGRDRGSLFIATKFGYEMPGAPAGVPYGSPSYVRWAVENSLRRLRVDYIDLIQVHRADPTTPIAETLAAIGELIGEGKVRWAGCSMFSAQQLDEAITVARSQSLPRLVSCMMHYSLLERSNEPGAIAACIRLGIAVLPFFPLEGGLLTGKYARGSGTRADGRHRDAAKIPPRTWQRLTELERFADARGISLLELSLGGLRSLPGVGSLFAGATTPAQVAANARAIQWTPSLHDIAALRATGGWNEP